MARLIAVLRERLGAELPLRVVFQAATPAELAAAISLPAPAAQGRPGLGVLLPIRRHGTRPPLFCVHPATGLSWCYQPLAGCLPADQPVYGLQARGLDGTSEPSASVSEMAADYVRSIRAVQGSGPYYLLGWSLGGLVAHEIAVQLQELGEQVAALAILDAYPQEADHAPAADARAAGELRLLQEQLGGLGAAVSPAEVAALTRVVSNNAAIMAAHRSRVFDGEPLLFVADENNPRAASAAALWKPYASGPVREFHMPCSHAEMARPDLLAQAWSNVSVWLNRKGE